jgi:hypothetical protein
VGRRRRLQRHQAGGGDATRRARSPRHPLRAVARAPSPRPQSKCHPQTIAVCQTRADGLGLQAVVVDEDKFEYSKDVCGVLVQYPATDGSIHDYRGLVDKAHAAGVKVRGLWAGACGAGGAALGASLGTAALLRRRRRRRLRLSNAA